MKYIISILCLSYLSINTFSQANKQNNQWPSGYAILDFNNSQVTTINSSKYLFRGFSNICDSNGILKLYTDGVSVFNKNGSVIQNGNLIIENGWFDSLGFDFALDQGSIILPFKNNIYYIFTPTASNTEISASWLTSNQDSIKYNFDELLYCVVDMNANNGNGLLVKKKIPLLQNTRDISIAGMTATKHANGTDWWLTLNGKNGNKIWTWKVSHDTIFPPSIKTFEEPYFDWYSGYGQGAFSKDGSIYAFVNVWDQQVFVSKFNRCTGEFNNSKFYNIPIDTYWDNTHTQLAVDSEGAINCSFSANNHFLYINTGYALKQLDLFDTNKITQWYIVSGPIQYYNGEFWGMLIGSDDKIYIGNHDGTPSGIHFINQPNLKGSACDFKYLPTVGCMYSLPNNPNYALGMDSSICWPLSNVEYTLNNNQISIYPNPTSGNLKIVYKLESNQSGQLEVLDLTGKIVKNITLSNNTFYSNINLESLQNGFYIYNYIVDGRLQESGKINIAK